MQTKFETIDCPLCGSNKFQVKYKAPDRLNLKSKNSYQIVTCLKCSFVYLNPRPKVEFLFEFYPNRDYHPFLSLQSALRWWERIYRWVRIYTVRWKRAKIEKLKLPGRILDIGCGTGEFLYEMKKHGWEVEGLEKDKRAAQYAEKKFGLRVLTLTNEIYELNILEKSFDVITMWHVLEHLYHPLNTLERVKNLLKDNGIVLIAVPNVASFDAHYYRNNWVALDAPRHLQHFVPETLTSLCESVGMEIFKLQQMPLDTFYNCLMSELLILNKEPMKKILLSLFLLRAFGIALISLIKGFDLKINGSSMLYFVQKQRGLQ